MNVDRIMDLQTIFNYAKTQLGTDAKANQWVFSIQAELNNKRPVDVLNDDNDGFKKCIEALDAKVVKLH